MQEVLLTQTTFIQDRESAVALRDAIEAFGRNARPRRCHSCESRSTKALAPTAWLLRSTYSAAWRPQDPESEQSYAPKSPVRSPK